MTKTNSNISSSSDIDYSINLGSSIVTGVLIFFYLGPLTVGTIEKIIISINGNAIDLLKKLSFLTYYVANGLITVYAIKLQRMKMKMKPIETRKKYLVSVSSVLAVLMFIRYVL